VEQAKMADWRVLALDCRQPFEALQWRPMLVSSMKLGILSENNHFGGSKHFLQTQFTTLWT
jgi:hypothetical protein